MQSLCTHRSSSSTIVSSPRLNVTTAREPLAPSSLDATTLSGARYTGAPSTANSVSPVRSCWRDTASPHELPGTAVLKNTAPVASTPNTAPIPAARRRGLRAWARHRAASARAAQGLDIAPRRPSTVGFGAQRTGRCRLGLRRAFDQHLAFLVQAARNVNRYT
mgnify:CR=1 FL=1